MFLYSTSGNYEDDNTADPDPDESAILDDEDDSLMSTSSIDPPESRRKGVFKKPSQPSKITPFQASLISSLDQATKTLQSPKNDPEDADKSYLMSLLPDYKNLTTAKKWEFRTYVANFFPKCVFNLSSDNLATIILLTELLPTSVAWRRSTTILLKY